MYTSSSKRSWDDFVKAEPYFAAVSNPKYLSSQLSPESEREFFAGGERHIAKVLELVRTHFDREFRTRKALDFGCGPGRLVVPLTHVSDRVTGADLNPHMIEAARNNSRRLGAYEADFHLAGELEKGLPEKFDFIHSVIVFQHIPVDEGERIFARLLDHLEPGGVGALHFTVSRNAPLWRKVINKMRLFGPLNSCINVMQGKDVNYPFAQMNLYDLPRLLQMLHARGIENTFLWNSTDGEYLSSMIPFRSPASK